MNETRLINVLDRCINNGKTVVSKIKESNFAPDSVKYLSKRFTVTQATSLVGVSREAIRKAELSGKLPKPHTEKNKKFYTLSDLNNMRDLYKTRPSRSKEIDETVVMAMINFKGGVYKSTTSIHYAQYMALKGYKVLLIDADSQATTTQLSGFTPDEDFEMEQTIASFLIGEASSLKACIKKTAWEGLDIIPANLSLYEAELLVPVKVTKGILGRNFYDTLRQGIETIKDEYDVIVIDAPPSLGIVSMNVVYAATGLVIPVPPQFADFCSTLQFFIMLRDTAEILGDKKFSFIKLLISKFDGSEEGKIFIEVIRNVFGSDLVMTSVFSNTAEIPRANQDLLTVYEMTDIKVKETHKRATGILNRINSELELLVKSKWPSFQKELEEEGVV